MAHEFVIKRNGTLETYTQYEDIPSEFDAVIKFIPEGLPEDHTDEDHAEMEKWNIKLQELLKRSKY